MFDFYTAKCGNLSSNSDFFFLFLNLAYLWISVTCRFADQVNATLTILHPIHCTRERKVHVVFDLTTIPAFLIVSGILYIVLKPRRPKPKINWYSERIWLKMFDPAERLSGDIFKGGMVFDFILPTDIEVIIEWRKCWDGFPSKMGHCEMCSS